MPRAVVLIGSLSDRELIARAQVLDILAELGVQADLHVISAHRNAHELATFCEANPDVDLYIASAALATALPGAVAGATRMRVPVIGVPLDEFGVDSCVRMPPGVPVLTTGVGRAGLVNAAIAAGQILAVGDSGVAERLGQYLDRTARTVQFNVSLDDLT